MDTKTLDRRFFGRTMSLPLEITRAEVRVKGAAIGVELAAERRAEEIQRRCLKAGLLFDAEGAQLLLLPPLNLSLADAGRGLDILERCL